MLTVQPHGALNSGFDLVEDTRGPVGSLRGSAWREGGRVQVGPQEWPLRRQGGRRFVLEGLATAERTSFWTGSWRVDAGDRSYELAKPSWWATRYEVREGGRVVGELHRHWGWLRSRTEITLPPDLPAPLQVFLVAVVLAQWRRDQAAAAGGAGAAAAASS